MMKRSLDIDHQYYWEERLNLVCSITINEAKLFVLHPSIHVWHEAMGHLLRNVRRHRHLASKA